MDAVSITSNAGQVLSELDADIARADADLVDQVRQGSVGTMKFMLDAAPVKTGFYRASFFLGVNEIPRRRIKVTRRRVGVKRTVSGKRYGGRLEIKAVLPRGRGRRGIALEGGDQLINIARANLGSALAAFDGKKVADLDQVYISNTAPHNHLIERGSSKQAPQGVFSIGRVEANRIFQQVAVTR